MSKRRELYQSVDEWALHARLLLCSLALTDPAITRNQSRELTHLLNSARWIETFKRRHPWKLAPSPKE